MHNSLLQTSWL